ncbi:reverse transcriptase domain-containing protein [Tanacetum coccineum]|uniref:Reverse transcriptase domain-containing protein n=1 Tax=Tanacetum coccineum TaxID=301880 RepID=A0ABQ5FEU3_9ASTR
MKKVIVELPLLTTLVKKETLYVYVAAATKTVSAVVLAERKGETMFDTLREQDVKRSREELCPIIKVGSVIVTHVQEVTKLPNKDNVERWTLFTDDALNSKGSEALNGKKDKGSRHRCEGGLEAGSESDQRQLRHQGDPHVILRNAHRSEVYGGESYNIGILLANHAQGRQEPGKLKFIIVAIDYFTKWIEAKPMARITGKDVKRFVWDNIVCRFRIPHMIVTNNGTQFVNDPFKGWCESLNIKQINMAVAHPQENGLVERANKGLIEGIKARLGRERVGWVDELPNVLWAYRTSLKQSNCETPFNLTYRSEAVIPAEIGMPTHRTMMIKEDENKDELRLNMDLL